MTPGPPGVGIPRNLLFGYSTNFAPGALQNSYHRSGVPLKTLRAKPFPFFLLTNIRPAFLKSEGHLRSPRREQGRRRPRNNDLRLLPARSCISSMDPEYLQGLREAKALLDEGIFSKEVGFSLGLPCECHTRLRSQNLNVRHWQRAKCTSSAELRLCACFRVILQARLISACAQDFEREKEKLTAERDARSQSSKVAASAVAAPSGNGSIPDNCRS